MKKVLLVDDEPDVLNFLSKKLETEGYAVSTAADGTEGLKKAISEIPDIILLDVMMPGKDGFETLSDLHSNATTRSIPVIMVTARTESASIFRGQEMGVTDYLVKPVRFEELLKYVRKYT